MDVYEDFLTVDECRQLIELAKPRLVESMVWDVPTGSQVKSDYRVSEQCFFGRGELPLVASIETRIHETTKTPKENGEGLQIVHYLPGGHYHEHYDYFDPAFEGNKAILARGGQRILTFMVYLNDVEEGGATVFPRTGTRVSPRTGKAICWRNLLEDGSLDPDTLHAAEDVVRGEKWIFTKWIREGPFI